MTGEGLKLQLVSRAGSAFLSTLGATLRFDVEGAEPLRRLRAAGQPVIFALWHSRLLPLIHLHRNEGVVALVSKHRDGEYIARVMQRRGFGTARGSSTRGGVHGMRQLIRVARSGRDLAITPDGPRGPARVLKMGAITVARVGRLPIIPVTAGCSRSWRAGSWDRFMVPKPFARIEVRYAPPVHVPRDADEGELERLRQELEVTLNRITDEVDGVGEMQP